MTINSRTKGKAGERELARIIYDHSGTKLVRNLEQTRNGGYDLIPEQSGTMLDNYAIQVKRYSSVTPGLFNDWWRHAVTQAEAVNKIPVLAYRANRQNWQVAIPLYQINSNLSRSNSLESIAVLSVLAFCAVVREFNFF